MHLVINATEIGRQRGGNESYIAGIIEGLAALTPTVRISLLVCEWNVALKLPATFQQINLGPYRRLPFFLWQQTLALKRLKADWYLSNFFLPPILPACKGAVVVHDLSFRSHPEYFPRSVAWYMHRLTERAIKQAARVLTVSEFSRRELFRHYEVAEEKVVTVLNGVSAQFKPLNGTLTPNDEQATLARYGIEKPYILALGNIHPRKNLSRLLDAYILLSSQCAAVPKMVWGGLARWESGVLLDRAKAAAVILPGFIAQADLPTLYRQAEMLVYPSLYEGFGLPPVEAMACGTPVITSNTTSLPEVVGEAGLTVDPTSTEEIAGAMAQLLDNASLRAQLQQSGLERARAFTWKHTAEKLLDALNV